MTLQHADSLTWVHVGDLHITDADQPNYRDFLGLVEQINGTLAPHINFCVLPGDNADDGTPEQYALVRQGLDHLRTPVHVIPGDHDRKPGDLAAFYDGLGIAALPLSMVYGNYRCLFLDVVSQGSGGPDFRLVSRQLAWLEQELKVARESQQSSVVFMHAYPADLKEGREALRLLLDQYHVLFVDMGHTHYNELANDGTTIFATTRSTGQIEEGPVGFSIASLNRGAVSWRFKPLNSGWPFVMITSPADHRLITDVKRADHIAQGPTRITARAWGNWRVATCRYRIDNGPWKAMQRTMNPIEWEFVCEAPSQTFSLSVVAMDELCHTDIDTIVVATPGYQPPSRTSDGSDTHAIAAWPERHLLGTRLGPNRNGRQW